MDRDERINSPLVALRAALKGLQADIWTALPAIVESYDPVKRTVSLQPTIQAQTQDKTTGAWTSVNLPILPDVPVLFPGAGDFLLTFPVKVGDEGLVVLASRCIDAFWQQGGVQPQAEQRMHDLSDGIFFPGPLSQAQEIPEVNPDNVQLRSKDGARYVEISDLLIKVKGNAEVDGNLHVTGTITWPGGTLSADGNVIHIEGDLLASGDIVANDGVGSVSLQNHTHGGVQVGGGHSGPPDGGT